MSFSTARLGLAAVLCGDHELETGTDRVAAPLPCLGDARRKRKNMFQIIGILGACWVLWMIKRLASNAVLKANLRLAIGLASNRGVPQSFSVGMIESLLDNMNIDRNQMGRTDPNFRTLPISEQYGNVLVNMYNDPSSEMELCRNTIAKRNAPHAETWRTVRWWGDDWHLQQFYGMSYVLKHLVESKLSEGMGWVTSSTFSAIDDDDACNKCLEFIHDANQKKASY